MKILRCMRSLVVGLYAITISTSFSSLSIPHFSSSVAAQDVRQSSSRSIFASTNRVVEPTYETQTISGWTVQIDRRLLDDDAEKTALALKLLRQQLEEIDKVVPATAVKELRQVTLWFSPEYAKTPPRAEYHPGEGWLRENGRNPAMVKGIEFTNVRIFETELRRMPNFALHELAHAYHDRVLPDGFGNQELREIYQRAKAGGKYERVERRDAAGKSSNERAYAMTNPQEYFAESSEAYFTRNDFYPFDRAQLEQHDPAMAALLKKLWGL